MKLQKQQENVKLAKVTLPGRGGAPASAGRQRALKTARQQRHQDNAP